MINYYLLMKPGIIFGNLVTVAAGFILGGQGKFDLLLFIETLLGLSFIMASGCVFNNYIDKDIDKNMERTKNRALVTGLISVNKALFFATLLGFIGALLLFFFTNTLTLLVAITGFFIYVVLYSLWKCHTVYATAIGSLAGAIPPVVGYCSASNHFDLAAGILILMMVFWQMPHFFSIALYRYDDYKKAGIPVLPVYRSILKTKVHMVIYIILFILTTASLSIFKFMGMTFLIMTLFLGSLWLALCIKGFKSTNDAYFGKQMFYFSLVVILFLSVAIPFDIYSS